MTYKNQLKDLALTVHEGQQIYIAVHNVILRDSATIMSFLKNLFGKGVPMSKLLEYAENLIPLWDTISCKMDTFKSSTYDFLSDDEKSYFDVLNNYVNALRITVDCLAERQKLMYNGSKGSLDNTITMKEYQEKDKAYKLAVNEYVNIGQQLNDANSLIFYL